MTSDRDFRAPLSEPDLWVLSDNETGLEVEIMAQTYFESKGCNAGPPRNGKL